MSDEERLARRRAGGANPTAPRWLADLVPRTLELVAAAERPLRRWEERWARENPGMHRDCAWPAQGCTCLAGVKCYECTAPRKLLEAAQDWATRPDRTRSVALAKAWRTFVWVYRVHFVPDARDHPSRRDLDGRLDPGPEWGEVAPVVQQLHASFEVHVRLRATSRAIRAQDRARARQEAR